MQTQGEGKSPFVVHRLRHPDHSAFAPETVWRDVVGAAEDHRRVSEKPTVAQHEIEGGVVGCRDDGKP